MTATLSPSPSIDRLTPRPVGHRPLPVSSDVDYGIRRTAAVLLVVLVVAVGAIAGSALAGALADVGGRPAAASATAPAPPVVRVHVAQPGDTLWSIADRHRGEVGHGRFVDALIDLNGGTVIQVGQAIRLP
jgi:nucleoid-associated protein YgaU